MRIKIGQYGKMEMTTSARPTKSVFARSAWAKAALAGAIVAASLWDFRLHDLRIFDLAAFAFLFAFFILDIDAGRDWLSKRIHILPLIAVVVIYAAVGYLNFHHRSSLAIIFLAVLCLQFVGYRDILWICRVFRWIVYLNVAVLLLQFFYYRVFGALLDFHLLFEGHSRLFSSHSMRPAGLFQEPNSYALNMFVVATVALLPKGDRTLALVAAGTMLMTESLWGIVAALVLVALNEWNAGTPLTKKIGMTLALWAAMFVAFNGYLWLTKPSEFAVPAVYGRVLRIGTDTSVQERYGSIVDRAAEADAAGGGAKPSVAPASNAAAKWLGNGLSTGAFVATIPANGLSFLWYCLGLVGLVLLVGAFGLALSGLALRDMLYIAGAVAFSFTTYPLVTYAIFWIWLPALIMLGRQLSDEPRPVLSQPPAAGR